MPVAVPTVIHHPHPIATENVRIHFIGGLHAVLHHRVGVFRVQDHRIRVQRSDHRETVRGRYRQGVR